MTIDKTLKECFDLNNSDKSFKHKYDLIYERNFSNIREEKLNLLEIGVFKGNSIAAWLDYFPNAIIYGVDIFERINEKEIEILKNPRVRWAKADSTKEFPSEWSNIKFDIIIDDGLHTPEANEKTFLNFFPMCSGSYFIEDVWPLEKMTEYELKHPWIKSKPEYAVEKQNSLIRTINQFGTVTYYDLRKETRQPDSYIIKVEI